MVNKVNKNNSIAIWITIKDEQQSGICRFCIILYLIKNSLFDKVKKSEKSEIKNAKMICQQRQKRSYVKLICKIYMKKGFPTCFPPLTSTNVGNSPKSFLTFSFKNFVTLM